MKRNALLQKKGSQNETSQDVLDEEDDDVRTTNVRASVATVEAAGQQRTTPKQPSSAKNLPPTSLFQGEPRAGETAHHQPFKEPPRNSIFQGEPWNLRASAEQKMVGLKDYGMNQSVYAKRQQMAPSTSSKASKAPNVRSVEELEDIARQKATKNSFRLLLLGNIAAVKVMVYYLINLETIITCVATTILTLYWYYAFEGDSSWNGGGMDFILLAFAVTSPISAALGMAFQRRERALIAVADFRSFSYHLYLAHCLWDWEAKGGRQGATNVDWLEHCDAVLAQLLGIGDELARFLSLPTTSRSRHRMTRRGRKEAGRTIEVAYKLLESMTTQRLTRLVLYSERLKKIGLPSGEISRIRQFERFISDIVEQLRMVKMYRSPQALRSFARIFTQILPPFYAPTFAQVARELHSVGMGVAFGIITAIGLTALFESLQVLEDPFTAFLALDGIDVREEFEVLHYSQLINVRKLVFPDASAYPPGRRAALTGQSRVNREFLGMPPLQNHHQRNRTGGIPDIESIGTITIDDQASLGDFLLPSVDQVRIDEELGMPLDEEDGNASIIRESYFVEADEDSMLDRNRARTLSNSTRTMSRHFRTNTAMSNLSKIDLTL